MKLYEASILVLLVFGVFGYLVYQTDKTAIDGRIQPKAIKEEIKEDLHDLEELFAKGGSANHDNYND